MPLKIGAEKRNKSWMWEELTYSQIETINRCVELSLFHLEEGILLSAFLIC